MKNLKGHQRDQVIYGFAILLQPFEDLSKGSFPPALRDYRIAIAKVYAGDNAWRQQVKQFTTFANDVSFNQEYQDISHVPEILRGMLKGMINDAILSHDLDQLKNSFDRELSIAREKFFEYIDRIPVVWEPVVFEANTPFTSYLRIKEAIAVVKRRLHYFDRYLKPDFFHLFLASIESTVSIRLVTTTGNASYGVNGVTSISNLARQQFSDYQLIEVAPKDLHDRNLRVDDQVFSLGPGVDRAGMALTNFGPSDSSLDAQNEFDRVIAGGHVVHQS